MQSSTVGPGDRGRDPKYRRHPLAYVAIGFFVLGVLVRWLLPRVAPGHGLAIGLGGTILIGIAIACLLLGIMKGGRAAQSGGST